MKIRMDHLGKVSDIDSDWDTFYEDPTYHRDLDSDFVFHDPIYMYRYYTDSDGDTSELEKREQLEQKLVKERASKHRQQLEKDKIAKEYALKEQERLKQERESVLKEQKQLEKKRIARERAARERESREWVSKEKSRSNNIWSQWLAEETSKLKLARNRKSKKKEKTIFRQAVDKQMMLEQDRLGKERVLQEQKQLPNEKLARIRASNEREYRIEKERVLNERVQLEKDRIARENVLKIGKQLEKDRISREHAAKAETESCEWLSEERDCPTEFQWLRRLTEDKSKQKVAKQLVVKSTAVSLMPTLIPKSRLNATLLTGQVTSNIKTVVQNKKLMYYIFISLGCDDKYLYESSLYELRELSKSDENYEIVKNEIKVNSKSFLENIVIEHVNNPYIKALYELKKLEMRNKFGKALQECYMFHATQKSKVNSILSTNLNHRLCGTQRGTRYGHGMSFSPTFNYSTLFCDKKFRKKVMLYCNVLFVKAHVGDENTIVPLEGYDSTKRDNNHVLVKYDDDVFYPTYKITFDMLKKQD